VKQQFQSSTQQNLSHLQQQHCQINPAPVVAPIALNAAPPVTTTAAAITKALKSLLLRIFF
jgi:hypothetical protein